MTGNRQRYLWLFIFIMAFLTSCGAKEDMAGQYFDIIAEDEQFFTEDDVSDVKVLSYLFAGEEPVLLWSEVKTGADGQASLDIWQRQADGRQMLLAQGIAPEYQNAGWYSDGAGCFYLTLSGNITKVRDTGEELFSTKVQKGVSDFCFLPDNRILVLLRNTSSRELAWLDAETGQLSVAANLSVDKDTLKLFWNSESNSLYLLDRQGVVALDITNGESERILSFQGTTYMFPQTSIKAFRCPDADRVELMLENGIKESLQYVDIGKEKNILTFRFGPEGDGGYTAGYLPWLKEQIAAFNRANQEYHVVFEADGAVESRSDYRVMTGVEMATGGGADIIYGDVVEENVYGLLEKGLFEDLTPYIENTVDREDYFPAAFDCWELDGKVYGVKFSMNLGIGWTVDESLVEGAAGLTLEGLVDTLLAYPGNAWYCEFFESEEILRDFLQGSQSLCGTVDWENRSCDFGGAFFSKILQVAKRYGYNPKEVCPELFAARSVSGLNVYDDSTWLESQGQTVVDYFFDDGRHLLSRKQALLAINANSAHKEGAWQFIEFLLQEEAQTRLMAYNDVPVSKIVFEKAAKSQMENGPLTISESPYTSSATASWSGSYQERMYYQEQKLSQEEIIERLWRTQEEVDEIRTALECAKPLPLRTMPILEIIYEEASYYFHDVKTLEEVTDIITNRVQLYLDEAL